MPKNIQDIIPSGRKSIRDIPIPIRKVDKARAPREEEESTVLPRIREEEDTAPRKKKVRSNTGIWIGSIVVVVLLAAGALSLRSGATLAYIPKTEVLSFSGDSYTAYQAAEEGQLAFSVIKLSSDKSIDAPATGEETVTDKARGQVVIYNEQTSAQSLVKTTRLETDGKIYRIQEDITIPAKGSVEVTAVADQGGTSYNIPLSDFTIPGFKGTPKFESVYARSKTPMTGGFSGTRKKVSEVDLVEAKTELESSLKSELLSQARAQMPEDFVLFPNLATITYEALPIENSGDSSAKVTLRGHLSAVIFKKSDLANYLVRAISGEEAGSNQVEVADFTNLDIRQSGSTTDLLSSDSIRLSITGAANARYVTDESSLASDLAGITKDGVDAVLAGYPSIESATSIIRPFWKSSFPSDPTKIKIEARQ